MLNIKLSETGGSRTPGWPGLLLAARAGSSKQKQTPYTWTILSGSCLEIPVSSARYEYVVQPVVRILTYIHRLSYADSPSFGSSDEVRGARDHE